MRAKLLAVASLSATSEEVKVIPGTLQEGGRPFHTTHWSLVALAAQSQSQEEARRALTDFCQAYWPPLYAFLRGQGRSSSDAQDLTQGFFAHLLEHDTLARASHEKGRLRTFLLGSLQHYLINEYNHARRLKRGGGMQIVSMDEHLAEAEVLMSTSSDNDAQSSYDQSWAVTLMNRVWDRLERALTAEGKERQFAELKPFIVGGSAEPPSQEQAAARLNVPISTLRTWLQRLRQRCREELRAEVARTVSTTAEIDEEMRYLHRMLTA